MMNCVRLWVMHALRKQQYTNGLDYSSAAEGVLTMTHPPGRTPLVTSAEYVTRVHNIVLGDRRITMGQIAEEVGC